MFNNLSEVERSFITQAAGLQLRIENLEAAMIEGGEINTDEIIRPGSECRRILNEIRRRHTAVQA